MILHISTSDSGGAGLAALRLHRSLLRSGVDSKMLVSDSKTNEREVYVVKPSSLRYSSNLLLQYIGNTLFYLVFKPLGCIGLGLTRLERMTRKVMKIKMEYPCFFTYPFSDYHLENHPLINCASIVHLHWVANFVDYPSFFRKIQKPIVWTVHDENIGLGGFHHSLNRIECPKSLLKIDSDFFNIKQKAIEKSACLTMIALSERMQDYISSVPFLSHRPIHIIPNMVEVDLFRPFNKQFARSVFNLPMESQIVLFVCQNITDKHKGLHELIRALEELRLENTLLLVVGGGKPYPTSLKSVFLGAISDPRLMALVYSASDLFVTPSFQETFGQTTTEAMATGLPVVSFPNMGSTDIITSSNGILTEEFTIESLKKCILYALLNKYDPEIIRSDMIVRFSPQVIVDKYIEIYNEIIHNNYKPQ